MTAMETAGPDGDIDVDPEAFLAALLHLSPADAAEVRHEANEKASPPRVDRPAL